MKPHDQLRELPSVDEVLQRLDSRFPRVLLVAEARRVIGQVREQLKTGGTVEVDDIPARVLRELESLDRPSLKRVINATGVILHTNLGRAPLPAVSNIDGYSNLEYDLRAGKRGKRDVHLAALIERLTGKPGIVVNNNAAAVYLVLNELAAGHEVIVSRGELIEIGDGFRIPDIMVRSGALLREVGTTNRTHIDDYRDAITDRTRLILRVHRSNFRITGFASRPELSELTLLSRESGIPLYEDLGSGCLLDLKDYGVDDPLVGDSIRAGVDLVSFSGDKLLGGPQAGIIAGLGDLVARIRRNPMYRAFRVDKLITAALEATLRTIIFGRLEELPTLRMISMPAARIRERVRDLQAKLPDIDTAVQSGQSVIGGGSTPDQSLPTYLLSIRCSDVAALERRLRETDPPVIARVDDEALLLDLRTVFESEDDQLAAALRSAYTR